MGLLKADDRLTFLGHAATVALVFAVLAAALPADWGLPAASGVALAEVVRRGQGR